MRQFAAIAAATWAALGLIGCGDDTAQKKPSLAAGADNGAGSELSFADTGEPADALGTDGAARASEVGEPVDGGSAEDALIETLSEDAGGQDAADVALQCPGQVGCACFADSNCPKDSACLPAAKGKVCVEPCKSGVPCPEDTVCITLPGADTASSDDDVPVCAPKFPHACDPCTSAKACGLGNGKAGSCVSAASPPGSKGFFCSSTCADNAGCPQGYLCGDATDTDGNKAQFCLPKSAECTCSDTAISAGLSTICSATASLPSGATLTCVGVRKCSQDTGSLTQCSAAVPVAETCNGLDDDCNGMTDDQADCDDGDPCTNDSCSAAACLYTPNTATCSDGDACTQDDACAAGKCKGGKALDCDDKNACTTDACNPKVGCSHANSTAACDDGDSCTANDACSNGKCSGGPSACPCQADSDCAKSEDGNPCNGTLYCAKAALPYVCKVNPATIVQCNPKDDTVCAVATCDAKDGKCKALAQNEAKPCDDGSVCTAADLCKGGVCAGTGANCNDGNVCTDDSCDPKAGCAHKANSGACSDGNPCTIGDACSDSACKAQAKSCDDGFACTADACDPQTGNCANVSGGKEGCGIANLPYSNAFACGADGLDQWQRSDWALPLGSAQWQFDATPELPGFATSTCSLNINNGKDLACSASQTALNATVESPWFAVAAGSSLAIGVRFVSWGNWTAQHSAKLQWRQNGKGWADIAVTIAPGAAAVQVAAAAGTATDKFQIRLSFSGPCQPGAVGWFVSNVQVFEDKCALNNGGCIAGQTCSVDANFKAACSACKSGFEVKNNQCTDIDECAAAGTCSPLATCANVPGSYTCACKAGYAGDGKTCADIDECASGAAKCGANAVCVNSPGSFSCTCAPNTVGDGKACFKKGSDPKAPAASCLEILTLYPGSADGTYWLDIDGAGPAAATQYVCDMKNGGWTLVIFDDFEDGTTKGWSAGKVTSCGDYGKILGGPNVFGKGAAVAKSVATPAHTQAKLFMQYVKGDTWDGETGIVQVNGNTVFSKKAYTGVIGQQCGAWPWDEDRWDVNWTGGHTAALLTLNATSTLDEGPDNEWFAIDNVVAWVK